MDPVEYAAQLYAYELSLQSFNKMIEAIDKIDGMNTDVSTGQNGISDLLIQRTEDLREALVDYIESTEDTIEASIQSNFLSLRNLMISRFDSVDANLVKIDRKLDDYFLNFTNTLSSHNTSIDSIRQTQDAIGLAINLLTQSHSLSDEIISSLNNAVTQTDLSVANLKSTVEVLSTASNQATQSLITLNSNLGSIESSMGASLSSIEAVDNKIINLGTKLSQTDARVIAVNAFTQTILSNQNAMTPKFAAIFERFNDMEIDHQNIDSNIESVKTVIGSVEEGISMEINGVQWSYSQILKQLMRLNGELGTMVDITSAETFEDLDTSVTFSDIDPDLTFEMLA